MVDSIEPTTVDSNEPTTVDSNEPTTGTWHDRCDWMLKVFTPFCTIVLGLIAGAIALATALSVILTKPDPPSASAPSNSTFFCGTSWSTAISCDKPCPGGNKVDCSTFGNDFKCFADVACTNAMSDTTPAPSDTMPSPTYDAAAPFQAPAPTPSLPPTTSPFFCGTTGNWSSAASCDRPCPNGNDDDCQLFGDGLTCYADVECRRRKIEEKSHNN